MSDYIFATKAHIDNRKKNLLSSHISSTCPHNTSMPCFILIHPTVWPQYTNVTDRTDRQDRQATYTVDNIGRTVLQTVAQKLAAYVIHSPGTRNLQYQHLDHVVSSVFMYRRHIHFTCSAMCRSFWRLLYLLYTSVIVNSQPLYSAGLPSHRGVNEWPLHERVIMTDLLIDPAYRYFK